jgi:hypothetical protein
MTANEAPLPTPPQGQRPDGTAEKEPTTPPPGWEGCPIGAELAAAGDPTLRAEASTGPDQAHTTTYTPASVLADEAFDAAYRDLQKPPSWLGPSRPSLFEPPADETQPLPIPAPADLDAYAAEATQIIPITASLPSEPPA